MKTQTTRKTSSLDWKIKEILQLNNAACDQRLTIHICIWGVWNCPIFPQQFTGNAFNLRLSQLFEFCKPHQHLNRLLSNFPNISKAVSLVAKFKTQRPFKVAFICIQRNEEWCISQNSHYRNKLKFNVGKGKVNLCRQNA